MPALVGFGEGGGFTRRAAKIARFVEAASRRGEVVEIEVGGGFVGEAARKIEGGTVVLRGFGADAAVMRLGFAEKDERFGWLAAPPSHIAAPTDRESRVIQPSFEQQDPGDPFMPVTAMRQLHESVALQS